MSKRDEIDELLSMARTDPAVLDRLFAIAYDDLRRRASQQLAAMGVRGTLHTTAVVNEAYTHLMRGRNLPWEGRRQFYFAAARAMRDVIIEHLRRRDAQKRGGEWRQVDLELDGIACRDDGQQILEINEALEELRRHDPGAAEVVLLRFFGGLTYEQIADATGSTFARVRDEWAYAQAWLARRLSPDRA